MGLRCGRAIAPTLTVSSGRSSSIAPIRLSEAAPTTKGAAAGVAVVLVLKRMPIHSPALIALLPAAGWLQPARHRVRDHAQRMLECLEHENKWSRVEPRTRSRKRSLSRRWPWSRIWCAWYRMMAYGALVTASGSMTEQGQRTLVLRLNRAEGDYVFAVAKGELTMMYPEYRLSMKAQRRLGRT